MEKISPYVFPILKHWLLDKAQYPYLGRHSRFTPDDVREAILLETNAPIDFLTAKSRKRPYADAKKIYCKICTTELRIGVVELAKHIRGYAHYDVLHARRAYDKLYSTDQTFFTNCNRIRRRLGIE